MFGQASGFASTLDLSALDGINGFQINGVAAGDGSGSSVASAGDVNGDGFPDLIIGAPGADPHGSNSGVSYVVFGQASGFSSSLNLSVLDGSNGFQINGEAAGDNSGSSVASAGDVNGDGIADLIIGASGALNADRHGINRGASYVVFGQTSGLTSSLDLSALDGSNGFQINGVVAGDNSGNSVASAGDVNSDGFADLIIGAPHPYYRGSGHSGSSDVVFGQASGFSSSLDLSALDGSDGFQINGEVAGDYSGVSVASAGDVNGDGIADLIIGATGDSPNGSFSGASYVVFGQASGFSSSLDLSVLDGSNGFKINGEATYDISGVSVASADDVNGDGFADLIIGATGDSPNGNNSGASYVVFGQASGFASSVELSVLDGSNGFKINGELEYGYSGQSVASVGDINGDGFADLIIGAPGLEGYSYGNGYGYYYRPYVNGSSYVIYGSMPDEAVARDGTAIANRINGGNFDDTLAGLGGDDTLIGHGGADSLDGGDGSDSLAAGAGNDVLIGGAGADRLAGGGGTDTADYTTSASGVRVSLTKGLGFDGDAAGDTLLGIENLSGSSGDDRLTGDTNANVLTGHGGNDRFYGGEGVDSLHGGAGADTLTGGPDADSLDGGAGTDTADYSNSGAGVTVNLTTGLSAGGDAEGDSLSGIENLTGSSSDDTLAGDANANVLIGHGGNDRLYGGEGADSLNGGTGDDTLTGGPGADSLDGGAGTDTANYSNSGAGVTVNLTTGLSAGGDAEGDSLSGIENLTGSSSDDTLAGDTNANVLHGGAGNDKVYGGGGADLLAGNADADTINGGAGSDHLSGNAGADLLKGGTAADVLIGNGGSDVLRGGGGDDHLFGGDGHDTIIGGKGDDHVTGGAMTDTFVFSGNFGHDTITDFSPNNHEKINLSAISGITGFHNLVTHHLSPGPVADFVVIDDGSGHTIVLLGFTTDDFGAGHPISGADFIFA